MTINWDTKISDIIQNSEVSVRLFNVIQKLSISNTMPISTIGEYLQLGERATDLFCDIQGMGLKSLDELDMTLKSYMLDPPANDMQNGTANTTNIKSVVDTLSDSLNELSMQDIVLKHDLSVRTQNFYKHQDFHKMDQSIVSLGGYLNEQKRAHRLMKTQPNVGQKTCDEVHTFIGKWLKSNLSQIFENEDDAELVHKIIYDRSLLTLAPTELERLSSQISEHDFNEPSTPIQISLDEEDAYDWDEIIASDIPAQEKTLKIISTILDERDFEIVVLRFGLGGKKFTLQALGDRYGRTRERIRQIESRAMKKLRIPTYLALLESVLSEREPKLEDTLFRRSSMISTKALSLLKKDVTTNDLFLIEVTYGSLKDWLSAKFITHKNGNKISSWSKEELSEDGYSGENSGQGPIHLELLNHILKLPWPTSLSELHSKLPGYPPTLIAEILKERYGVKFVDGKITTIENLPMRHRLVIILKRVGNGLHTSEIASHHLRMFGIATNEHAVGAVLMRLDEALITARGVYDLYENLNFTETELKDIRDQSYGYLKEKEVFVSSKIIFRDLFWDKVSSYSDVLNAYTVHGIIQDDQRFEINRGLMVGLKEFPKTVEFKSLESQVYNIIQDHAPLSEKDLKNKLENRSILSVHSAIMHYSDIVVDQLGRFTTRDKLFTDEKIYWKIVDVIFLNSYQNNLAFEDLEIILKRNNLVLHPRTIKSIIRHLPGVTFLGGFVKSDKIDDKYKLFLSNQNKVEEKNSHYNELFFSEFQKDKNLLTDDDSEKLLRSIFD